MSSSSLSGLQFRAAHSGILIFLSAVVGVVDACSVQVERKGEGKESQIEHAQHLRKQRLVRVRLQITEFVGPASMYAMGLWDDLWMSVMGDEAINKFGVAPRNNLNKLSKGRLKNFGTRS